MSSPIYHEMIKQWLIDNDPDLWQEIRKQDIYRGVLCICEKYKIRAPLAHDLVHTTLERVYHELTRYDKLCKNK